MPVTLTRTVGFRAVNRLYREDWSEARNRDAFGALSEPTVAGPVDPHMAMVFDLAQLDRILQEEVVDRLDGKHLNRDVPSLAGTIPTCEAIAVAVFRHLLPRLPRDVTLERVRIMEDPTLYADCTGLD